jgi:hypothetical protein
MARSPHMGIFRVAFKPRPSVDFDLSSACENASGYLTKTGVQFEHRGTEENRAFVDLESKKVPMAMRVLREKGFNLSVVEVQPPTVRFPRLRRIVMFPRAGRKIEDEHLRAMDDLTVACLYPFGSGVGFGRDWGEGYATFDVEDFNLEATLKVLCDGGYEVSLDQ